MFAAVLDPLQLTGRSATHVVPVAGQSCLLHAAVAQAWQGLQAAAAADAIHLQAVSGFRDFARQQTIWNGKCRGERPLVDAAGQRLDALCLTPEQRVAAILEWSALPGASRHHWGSDLDVIDAAALPAGQSPQLVPAEYAAGGVFERLARWLDSGRAEDFGFFRPYAFERGGVRPEPWHLSWAPLAVPALQALTVDCLAAALQQAQLDTRIGGSGANPD
jgi:LAS superfamily LD-carboxypeptidase LdcB